MRVLSTAEQKQQQFVRNFLGTVSGQIFLDFAKIEKKLCFENDCLITLWSKFVFRVMADQERLRNFIN